MIKEKHLIETADYFSRCPAAFSLKDFTGRMCGGTTNSECRNHLKNDPRFVRLTKSHLDDETVFVSELSLFRWWFSLNARMSFPYVSKTTLAGSELAEHMNLLGGKKRIWSDFHDKAVEYGRMFGFVSYNSLSSLYVFPLAHLFSQVRRHSESMIDTLYDEMSTTDSRDGLLRGSFHDLLTVLIPREEEIIRLRFGIECEKSFTLEDVGRMLGLTRERIRQIEKTALSKIRPDLFLRIFLAEFVRKPGSLLVEENSINTAYAKFAKMLLGIPYERLPEKKMLFLGSESSIESEWFLRCMMNAPDSLSSAILDKFAFLSEEDINSLEPLVRQRILRKALNSERIYIALKRIGKPAHYTDITETHNQLFPEKEMSNRGIHAFCCDSRAKGLGIVWVGMKGIYGLEEWGYKKPETDLFETVTIIVNHLYKETGKPVSLNSILAEIGKYRKAVNPKSVAMAASLSKGLERLPNNFIIPRDENENSAGGIGISEEEMGKKIVSFRREQQNS